MSVVCPSCGNRVETDADGNCPRCARPVQTLSGRTMPAHREALPGENGAQPAPSAMPAGDAEMLRRGNMHAPSQLGSLGRIGKFEITKHLGRGGMAQVFLATEPVTGVSVALKTLRTDLADDPRIAKAFLSEARHMYELSHPNILKVLEVSDADEGAFFVMPYVRAGSLSEKITPGGMPGRDVLTIAVQIAEGLTHAHGKGLLHRDLKPANVLLDNDGRAMIADFGLVRPFFNDSLVDLGTARLEGTPAYMSPRVAAGLAEDTRADIYAFGAVLYEMLAGHPPYTGHDPMGVVQAVVDGPPPALATVVPHAPPGLVAVAEWCMARELRDRYASMNDVLEDLKRLAVGSTPRGPHDAGGTGRRVHLVVLAAVVAAVVLAILGALAFLSAHREPRQDTSRPNRPPFPAAAPRRHGIHPLPSDRRPPDARPPLGGRLPRGERRLPPREGQQP